jgi:membrane-bound lytic murein transglycosylase A
MTFLLLFGLLSGVALAQEVTPTERVHASLEFKDDLDFENLSLAVSRQLEQFARRGLKGTIRFGTKTYPRSVIRESLLLLERLALEAKSCLELLPRQICESRFSREVNQRFAIYRPLPMPHERGHASKKTYFTAYYTPDFQGSYQQDAVFKNPIFGLPQTEEDRRLTRVEIDFDRRLDGKGLELMWVKETLFDIYFMHIQGGGRVQMPDGKVTYLSYAGKNGHQFRFISQWLIETGLMERSKTNYWTQRAFLEENPQHQRGAYATSPSFVYFQETSVEPYGLDNISLTVGRSLAWDNTIYKTLGVINFVQTVKTTHWNEQGQSVKVPFSRFFISQDTGSAIRGNARVDLYWGYGEEALFVARDLLELGDQYFLIKQ